MPFPIVCFSPSYFEDDEEESSTADLPYIPAENSPTRQQMQSGGGSGGGGGGGGGSDSDDDPLDAFMAEVEVRSHTTITCSSNMVLVQKYLQIKL